MIKELWNEISLKNYNKWYPLTGAINDTPEKYINTWQDVNEWFTTFAIRAQNDINAYLNFILYKFPFDSFKDKLIKETLSDMVYVMIEHWVFNRTPIEFNVEASIQFNNGSQFSASSIPTINVWDLAPSRMKILAQLTQLKQLLMSYDEQEIDVEKIDLAAFYTKNQVDELIDNEKAQRISADKNNHDFILTKQMKLYDDVVSENEHEVYRGPVTNLVVKGFIATDYDKDKETAVINFPKEIGTLPPEALQNNPQENDFTHAATADFSAKQQKRITTNENNIKLTNDNVDINKKNIDDIKNNYFNIETSPLWRTVWPIIPTVDENKWHVVFWTYVFQELDPNGDPIGGYYIVQKTTKFQLLIRQTRYNKILQDIILDKLILKDNTVITLLLSNENKVYLTSNNPNYPTDKFSITNMFKYIGTGTPTEFIAENNNNDNYYTKTETNELLDKKQNKLIAGTNITIDENNKISATSGSTDLSDYYKKEEVDKKLEDTESKFPIAFAINAVGAEIPNLKTIDKTIAGAINENLAGNRRTYKYASQGFRTINELIDELTNKKQSKTDNTLITDAKTVVGAINELKNSSSGGYSAGNGINIKEGKINVITDINEYLAKELLETNKYNMEPFGDAMSLYTAVKLLGGIIKSIQDNLQPALNAKQDKLTAGDNITIENNKISFDKNCLPDYFNIIAAYQHIDHLDTKAATIVGAINELNEKIKLIPIWKEVGTLWNNSFVADTIKYNFKDKTHYRVYISEPFKNYIFKQYNFYFDNLNTTFGYLFILLNNNENTKINIYKDEIVLNSNVKDKLIFEKLEELQE